MSNIKLKSFPCLLKRFCLSNRLFSNSSALRQHILASHKGKSVPAARTWVRLQSASAPEDQFRPTQNTQPALNSQLTQDAQPTQGSQSTQSIHSSQDSQSFQNDSYLDDLEPHYTNGNEQSQEPGIPLETEAPDLVNATNNRWTTQHNLKELREEKIGGDIWSELGDTGSWPQAVDVPDIDLMLAEFALDCNLSNANYTQ
ncbi:hypothetical protein BJV82DRAFT_636058 [Fennellomyces sp. T-0311]|nr:hypothetical protein BJV82DRAFT_636058 [Fennellomyces sp. T-0311]